MRQIRKKNWRGVSHKMTVRKMSPQYHGGMTLIMNTDTYILRVLNKINPLFLAMSTRQDQGSR